MGEASQTQRVERVLLKDVVNEADKTNNGNENLTPADPDEAEIDRLARLSVIDYDREREQAAKTLKVRVGILDKLVSAARGGAGVDDPLAGRAATVSDIAKHPEPVDGVTLFEDAERAVKRFIKADDWQIRAGILWAVHTHCFRHFNCSPRIVFDAPMEDCGKTACLTHVFGAMANRQFVTGLITPGPFFRLVEKFSPTWLIDEADVFMKTDAEINAALNAGFEPKGCVPRCCGLDMDVRLFSVFSPVALAGKRVSEKLPQTMLSRSIVIHLQRAMPDEITFFESDQHAYIFDGLASKIARWVSDNLNEIVKPVDIPSGMLNRNRMKWTPLLKIARAISPNWYEYALDAWRRESQELGEDSDKENVIRLLKDIRDAFGTSTVKMTSKDLVLALVAVSDGKWSGYNFKAFREEKHITEIQVANLLRPYKIRPKSLNMGDGSKGRPKGYYRKDFAQAWDRYLRKDITEDDHAEDDHDLSATPLQPNNHAPSSDFGPATGVDRVAGGKSTKPALIKGSSGVADSLHATSKHEDKEVRL